MKGLGGSVTVVVGVGARILPFGAFTAWRFGPERAMVLTVSNDAVQVKAKPGTRGIHRMKEWYRVPLGAPRMETYV